MIRRVLIAAFFAVVLSAISADKAEAQQAYGRQWGSTYSSTDWARFYHYPYVYYPQNFQKPQEYDHLYYRYGQERQIPVYNKDWHNFYPSKRPYHWGHHFILDIF